MCVCVFVGAITFELNDLRPRYLACLSRLALFRVKLEGYRHGTKFTVMEGNVVKVVGATSSEGFIVYCILAKYQQ